MTNDPNIDVTDPSVREEGTRIDPPVKSRKRFDRIARSHIDRETKKDILRLVDALLSLTPTSTNSHFALCGSVFCLQNSQPL